MKLVKIYTINKASEYLENIAKIVNKDLKSKEITAVQGFEANGFIILNFFLDDTRKVDQEIFIEGYAKISSMEALMNTRIASLPDNYLVKKALLIPSGTLRVLSIIVAERIDNGTESKKESERTENKKINVKSNSRAKSGA